MVEVMKIMVTSFKRSSATLPAPDPAAGHHGSMSPLETPGHSWESVGQSLERSLLLFPGPCCAQPLFLPSCVSSGGSLVGLMVTFSKRA